MPYVGDRPAQGNIINRIMENSTSPTPVAGMDATSTHWSDRYAGKIIWVSQSGKTLHFVETDWGHGPAASVQEAIKNGHIFEYTLRKNGRWVMAGESMKNGTHLIIGVSDPYYDPSF